MSKSFLIKLGAPILALSLIAACGTDEEQDPIEEDVEEEAPLAPEDEAPLNQEDDNGDTNPAENEGGDGGLMDEDGMNGNGGDNGTNGTDDAGTNGTNGTDDAGTDGTTNDNEDSLIGEDNENE